MFGYTISMLDNAYLFSLAGWELHVDPSVGLVWLRSMIFSQLVFLFLSKLTNLGYLVDIKMYSQTEIFRRGNEFINIAIHSKSYHEVFELYLLSADNSYRITNS